MSSLKFKAKILLNQTIFLVFPLNWEEDHSEQKSEFFICVIRWVTTEDTSRIKPQHSVHIITQVLPWEAVEVLRAMWFCQTTFVIMWCEVHSVVSDSLRPHGLYSPWNSPGQNTGAGSLSLLQGIFPTQGSNPGIQHCRGDSLPDEPQGKPLSSWRLLHWANWLYLYLSRLAE